MTLSATFFKLQTPRRRLVFSNMADLARTTMTCLNFNSSNFLALLHYTLATCFSVYNDNKGAQTLLVLDGDSLLIVRR